MQEVKQIPINPNIRLVYFDIKNTHSSVPTSDLTKIYKKK